MNIKNFGLPENFLIGTGTSSFQCEGGITNSDWYKWELNGDMPVIGDAVNFWDNYKEWIDKAASVGNVFRMSLEWSRIEPRLGYYDMAAIQHYQEILEYCKLKGLTTVVALHHFTSPIWLAEKGGWTNPDVAKYFYWYAATCATYLRGLADYWITINEPQIYAGSRLGAWPEKYSFTTAISVLFNRMVNAHNMAYKAIHEVIPDAKVGTAQNVQYFHGNNFVGKIISEIADMFWNFGFLNKTVHTHDFIGINYYGEIVFPLENSKDVLANLKPNPRGLKIVLEKLYEKFHKPIMITENGVPTEEGVLDQERFNFIEAHLSVIGQTLEARVKVIGYIYWSLMDTYEIQGAYNIFMGLFTRDGTPKNSAKLMQDLLSESQSR